MKITIERGVPCPLGVTVDQSGINFAYVSREKDCGVVLFRRGSRREYRRIPFCPDYAVGDVYCMHVSGIPAQDMAYCFYEGTTLRTDERGKDFPGGKKFGSTVSDDPVPAFFPVKSFDWEGDCCPHVPYEDSVCYCMHVRGFTRHASSGVKHRGTFAGVMEKLPYLKQLGITTLELQPVYEFAEYETKREKEHPFADQGERKLNYWGYAGGNYYSPKSSYAAGDASEEFKTLIKALHKEKMEAVLQFYFTDKTSRLEIQDILRYWVTVYHVDGFHLKGENIDPGLIAEDPVLARTKLWYYGFPETPGTKQGGERYKAEYKDDFRYNMRRFLKGDEGMLQTVMYHLKHNPVETGQINYLTNYDGFTMMDLVSYDRKHNEENGEDNKDGNDYNASWNCGHEGATRKRSVLALRRQQMKNAWMLLLLSQGTPLFFMGDEFGNSQKGNNNPYCQDNDIAWLNWKNAETNSWLLLFVRNLIKLRREHPVFHQPAELRLMDYASCGYPDLSYHGEAPWKPELASYSRQLGVMYCGDYAHRQDGTADDFFYVAYNMHWEPHRFSLPKLPKDFLWQTVVRTDDGEKEDAPPCREPYTVEIPPRSIRLFAGILNGKDCVKHECMGTF